VNCPACGEALLSGAQTRCPSCAALLAGPTEGALAPNPQLVTPPARNASSAGAAESAKDTVRQLPGLRKRERTWKDEVRDRVRNRRQVRGEPDDLPLFRDREEGAAEEGAPDPAAPEPAEPEASAPAPASDDVYALGPRELGDEPPTEADLILRSFAPPAPPPPVERPAASPRPVREARPNEEEEDEADDREWKFEPPAPIAEARPVERPAYAGERAQAALVDFVLMLAVWAVVIYFAGRAARVDLPGLRPSWPYLFGYLAFLGLAYAACFTGVTGQTLGKMLKGLRVVNSGGRPPGFPRAFLRAALGSLGVVLAFGGVVPMFFDPARRGLHDRLLKTRVIKG
jgi:uncharacterized RDD family membrane protein YckC